MREYGTKLFDLLPDHFTEHCVFTLETIMREGNQERFFQIEECCFADRGVLKIREEDFTYPPVQVRENFEGF